MPMPVIALLRIVTSGVAIYAAGMDQNGIDLLPRRKPVSTGRVRVSGGSALRMKLCRSRVPNAYGQNQRDYNNGCSSNPYHASSPAGTSYYSQNVIVEMRAGRGSQKVKPKKQEKPKDPP
jgi:hypothetical protein